MPAQPAALEHHPTPNYVQGRAGDSPRAIVLHTTVGTWEAALDWFARPESGVCAHYVVALDGRVAQLVDEGDTARHAGRVLDPTARLVRESDTNPNLFTIGIEFEDGGRPFAVERPAAQYAAGARLVAAACKRWGIPLDRDHVIGHGEIYAAKECPGNLETDRVVAEARSIGTR
jgi:N-acetyl-anhydromuramyl-L-alanine amidase AmpD